MKFRTMIGCLFLTVTLALSSAQTAVTYTTLDFPGSDFTSANGINSSGQIVGDYNISGIHGFLLSDGVYTTIDFPGTGTSTWCEGINDAGEIVGWYIAPGNSQPQGFLMQGDVFTTLNFPGATYTEAWGVNNAGQIVGEYSTGVGVHAFLYQSGTYTDVTVTGASYTQLRGINNFGDMVGRFASSFDQGLLIRNGTYIVLNAPGAMATNANGLNDLGRIVGYEQFPTATIGFEYYRGSYQKIAIPGDTNFQALGINNNLDIVGQYTDSQNVTHGFLRTP